MFLTLQISHVLLIIFSSKMIIVDEYFGKKHQCCQERSKIQGMYLSCEKIMDF
jgi:hypothetical protein